LFPNREHEHDLDSKKNSLTIGAYFSKLVGKEPSLLHISTRNSALIKHKKETKTVPG
jgi:hypothetical protein